MELNTSEQAELLSHQLAILAARDAAVAQQFEQEWAFALSAVETGGEGELADGELAKMNEQLAELLGDDLFYVYYPSDEHGWGPFASSEEAWAFVESDEWLESWTGVWGRRLAGVPLYAPSAYHGRWPL